MQALAVGCQDLNQEHFQPDQKFLSGHVPECPT
eukprot:Gb_31609 [translate_table: standard]